MYCLMFGVLHFLLSIPTLYLSLVPQHVMNFINHTWMERYESAISEQLLTFLWSIIVSIFTIGGLVGAYVGGTMSIKYGRYSTVIFLFHSHYNLC